MFDKPSVTQLSQDFEARRDAENTLYETDADIRPSKFSFTTDQVDAKRRPKIILLERLGIDEEENSSPPRLVKAMKWKFEPEQADEKR